MSKKIKLLKQVGEIPAGTVGVSWGLTRATGGLTLRFDRPGHAPEVLTNVNAGLVEDAGPYVMETQDYYGVAEVPASVFSQLDERFFISKSDDRVKYLCANSREREHLLKLNIRVAGVVCDWYKIKLTGSNNNGQR